MNGTVPRLVTPDASAHCVVWAKLSQVQEAATGEFG